MRRILQRFQLDQDAATGLEYGLIAAIISLVIIGSARYTGTWVANAFTSAINNLAS